MKNKDAIHYRNIIRHTFSEIGIEGIELFLEAKAKYCTFTTMHMWGFSNFDHPATKFDIMSTPYGKDIAAQLDWAAAGKLPVM